VKDLGFTDLKEQTSALNRVDLRSCYYLNHISCFRILIFLQVIKDGNGCSWAEINANLHQCKNPN
jgi:ribonuclease PH